VWRSPPSNETESLSFTVQEQERGRELFASLKTEAAMSGKCAAILIASGCGSRVVLEAKKMRTACGRGGVGFTKASLDATATEEAVAAGFA